MFRLMGMTFYGKSRVDPAVEPHVHESPPLDDAAAHPAGHPDRPARASSSACRWATRTIPHWLEPVFLPAEETLLIDLPEYELFGIDGALIIVSVAIAALGIGVGIWLFGFFRQRGPGPRPSSA